MGKIYMFDNNTGREIPEKINTQKVDLLLGSTVEEIHKLIIPKSSMLCIFTKIKDFDIIVPTENDANILRDFLNFGHYNYTVGVVKSSIWYSDKVSKNIIISDSVDMNKENIAFLLAVYLNFINKDGSAVILDETMYIYPPIEEREYNTIYYIINHVNEIQ